MVRCVGKFIIALLLFGLLPAASLAQPESGEIVFRPWSRPYGYADVFYPETCNMYLPNATANSTLPDTFTMFEGTSDTSGVIFALDPGNYWLHSGIPGDFSVQRQVTCKSNGTAIPHPVTVVAGDQIECEQLIFPSSGRESNPPDELDLTLTIRARSCDLPIARSAFHDACFDNAVPDELFYISADRFDAEITTDADGNASVDVPDFTLEIDPTGDLFGARVWRFCSSADHPGVPLLYPLNLLYHSAPVTCDIYFLPETYDLAPDLPDAETGQIEVHYRLCPPGFSIPRTTPPVTKPRCLTGRLNSHLNPARSWPSGTPTQLVTSSFRVPPDSLLSHPTSSADRQIRTQSSAPMPTTPAAHSSNP